MSEPAEFAILTQRRVLSLGEKSEGPLKVVVNGEAPPD